MRGGGMVAGVRDAGDDGGGLMRRWVRDRFGVNGVNGGMGERGWGGNGRIGCRCRRGVCRGVF